MAKMSASDLDLAAERLSGLIRESLRRGHTRVALQRALMLHRLCGDIPPDLAEVVEHGTRRLPTRELGRMQRVAADWASMLEVRPW